MMAKRKMMAKIKVAAIALGLLVMTGCITVGPVVTDVTLSGNRLVVEKTTYQYNDFTGQVTEKSRTIEDLGEIKCR